jgi:hypothetical protein
MKKVFDETMENVAMMRSWKAFLEMQKISKQHGNDSMTLEEINAEIAAARRDRVARVANDLDLP